MATIDTIISSQRDLITNVLGTASSLANRIATGGQPSISNPTLSYAFSKPNLAAPPTFGELLPGDTSGSTIQFLESNIDRMTAQYFPELNGVLRDTPERWACGILTGEQPLGLSQEAFDLAWHQSRDREYRTRETEVRQITSRFSAAGFSMPIGPMASAIIQAEQRASGAIGDVNRAQTIRDTELKYDMLRFASEQAFQYKTGMMRLIADLYRFFLEVPNRDVDLFRAKAQAYAASQDALSSYYRVELGFEELRLRAAEAKAGTSLNVDRNRIAAAETGNSASALAQASRGFTDTASAAANAQSALIADLSGGA